MFDRDAPTPYVSASKGEKPTILAWLRGKRRGPWFAAIADSGQKQVLPYAPVNAPGGRGKVLFDDTIVVLPDKHGWRLVDDMVTFLTAGATKEEIARGEYNAGTWTRCRAAIEAFEQSWSVHRGGSFFALAIWLAQRDEEAVQARVAQEKQAATEKKLKSKEVKQSENSGRAKRKAQDAGSGSSDCVPSAIPINGSVGTDALGHSSEPELVRCAPKRDDGPVGLSVGAGASTPVPRQGSLFGDLGADDVRPRTRKRR